MRVRAKPADILREDVRQALIALKLEEHGSPLLVTAHDIKPFNKHLFLLHSEECIVWWEDQYVMLDPLGAALEIGIINRATHVRCVEDFIARIKPAVLTESEYL